MPRVAKYPAVKRLRTTLQVLPFPCRPVDLPAGICDQLKEEKPPPSPTGGVGVVLDSRNILQCSNFPEWNILH